MTRDQVAELLAIGGAVPGANHVATTGGAGVWLDNPAQRVLRVLGYIEIVPESAPHVAIRLRRKRQFVKLTDKGLVEYLRLIAVAAEGVVERAGQTWDNEKGPCANDN